MSNNKLDIINALSGQKTAFKVFYTYYESFLKKFFNKSAKFQKISNKEFEKVYHDTLINLLIEYKSNSIDKTKLKTIEDLNIHIKEKFTRQHLIYLDQPKPFLAKQKELNLKEWENIIHAIRGIDNWLEEEIVSITKVDKEKRGIPGEISREEFNELNLIANISSLIDTISSPPSRSYGKIKISVNKISRGTPSNI